MFGVELIVRRMTAVDAVVVRPEMISLIFVFGFGF